MVVIIYRTQEIDAAIHRMEQLFRRAEMPVMIGPPAAGAGEVHDALQEVKAVYEQLMVSYQTLVRRTIAYLTMARNQIEDADNMIAKTFLPGSIPIPTPHIVGFPPVMPHPMIPPYHPPYHPHPRVPMIDSIGSVISSSQSAITTCPAPRPIIHIPDLFRFFPKSPWGNWLQAHIAKDGMIVRNITVVPGSISIDSAGWYGRPGALAGIAADAHTIPYLPVGMVASA